MYTVFAGGYQKQIVIVYINQNRKIIRSKSARKIKFWSNFNFSILLILYINYNNNYQYYYKSLFENIINSFEYKLW